jgi:hypothetical protein
LADESASWRRLLQDAANVRVMREVPWMLASAARVFIVTLGAQVFGRRNRVTVWRSEAHVSFAGMTRIRGFLALEKVRGTIRAFSGARKMTPDEELRIAAAKYALDAIPSWELSELANRLFDIRLTARAAVELATLREPIMAEAGPLFERILEAEQVTRPSKDEALWTLLRHYIGAIANGSATPRSGLGPMMSVLRIAEKMGFQATEYVGDSHDIQSLVGAYWSYEDIDDAARVVTYQGADEERKSLDIEVVQRAKEWMTTHGGA